MIRFDLDSDKLLLEDAFEFAQQQVKGAIEKHPDFYPMYTIDGKWRHEGAKWTHWCDGFLPGMMWLFRRYHADRGRDADARYWMDQAIRYTTPLEPRKFDRDVHDLGFIFMNTYYRWYRVTGDKEIHDVVVQAGKTLAMRFKEKGQYLRSFVSDDSLFIDIMMNVGIIYYAARETADRQLMDVAIRHSMTTRRVLVRGDGSTSHEGLFDLESGEFLRQTTHQGFRGDSCWSRGLTWSLYGFATCYEFTHDPHFLRTAEMCADFYIAHTPSDGVPPWDYNAPAESRQQVDTSAAAIAAAGLLRLCRLIPDPVKGHFYWETAIRILRTLCESYLGKSKGWEGILKGGVYHIHKDLGVNESVMWGEHFFVEALEQALRRLS
ncbi:MAG: glycoside hydrolase family 88 protein [Bryobacteraceae bacterium]